MMLVDKFYALYEKSKNEAEVIDVYQAIKLVHVDAVISTKKENCPFFDIETNLKVSPVRAKNPHFKYYSDEESPLKGRESQLEYTLELKAFIRAFEEITAFKIEEWKNEPVRIIPKDMKKLKRIETTESFVVLKYYIELKETKPYSYYYKWNGRLGLEFSVTSQPEPIKRKELGEKGIPLFRSNVEFPAWLSVSKEFPTEAEFEAIAKELRTTYQDRNYRLQGEFINQSINFPDYKEKYIILNDFERQCYELEEQKKELERIIENQRDILAKIESEKKKQLEITEKERTLLEKYRIEKNHYEEIKEDNLKQKQENAALLEQKTELRNQLTLKITEIEQLREENGKLASNNEDLVSQQAIEEPKAEKNIGIFRIFNQGK